MEVSPFNFISVIAIVLSLGALGGHFMNIDTQDETDDTQNAYMTENRKLISEFDQTEAYDDTTINQAIQAQEDRITTLSDKIDDIPTVSQVMTLTEKNQIINEINSLKSKMTFVEQDIDDLESDSSSSSSSSSSSNRNTFTVPSCRSNDISADNTSRAAAIDSFRDTELDDDVVFTGIGNPRDQVELWICQPDDSTAVSGGNIRIPSDGEWTINCQARVCAGETGDHIAFLEIIATGELTRTIEYEVER